MVTSESIQETINLANLHIGNTYKTRFAIEQNNTRYPYKTSIQIIAEHSIVYGVPVYIGFIQDHRVLVTADDVH